MLVLGAFGAAARLQPAAGADETPAVTPTLGGLAAKETLKPAQISDDYRIMPADILDIAVFQETDLKSMLRVSNEGAIAFPLIGVVSVGGMTPQQAAQAIGGKLAQGYLINPQVSVTVMEFAKRRFTVLGEVQKPGSYDMPDQQGVTVLQAIGMAGGYTRIANAGKVTLMRRVDGKQKTFDLNAKKMATGKGEAAFSVLPGDVITVAESRF
jgi:polysaccharide export outer membrane protein